MAKIKKKLLVLRFEDPDYEGVEIKVRTVSMGRALELTGEADAARAGKGLDDFNELLNEFIGKLESWNIEDDDDQPLPATREGFLSLDLPDVVHIILSWFDAMLSIDTDLGKDSTSGLPSPEVSIPMETLSESPLRLPMPN